MCVRSKVLLWQSKAALQVDIRLHDDLLACISPLWPACFLVVGPLPYISSSALSFVLLLVFAACLGFRLLDDMIGCVHVHVLAGLLIAIGFFVCHSSMVPFCVCVFRPSATIGVSTAFEPGALDLNA